MHIVITEERRGTTYRIQCDFCAGTIDIDEDCEYLTPRSKDVDREARLVHRHCAISQTRFKDQWSQVVKPRHIIQYIAEHNRHPVITDFLRELEQKRKDRESHP